MSRAPSPDSPPIFNGEPEKKKAAKAPSMKKVFEERAKLIKDAKVAPLPDDDTFRGTWPLLWEAFTLTQLADRWTKQPPALTITIDNGLWRATFRDADLQIGMSVTAAVHDQLLHRLEAALANPENWTTYRKRSRGLKDLPSNK